MQYGKNFQQLNKGIPPNSFVRIILAPADQRNFSEEYAPRSILMESTVVTRASDPDFYQVKEVSWKDLGISLNLNEHNLLIKVFHRAFSADRTQDIHKFTLIGESILPLKNIVNSEGKISFNDFLNIEPVTMGSTQQSARPMLKLKISGDTTTRAGSSPKKTDSLIATTFRPIEEITRTPAVNEESEEEEVEFNQDTIANALKTLQEVDEHIESIHGSATKIRVEERIEPEEDDNILDQHTKAFEDIAAIHRNLDSLFQKNADSDHQEDEENRKSASFGISNFGITGITERQPNEPKKVEENPFERNLEKHASPATDKYTKAMFEETVGEKYKDIIKSTTTEPGSSNPDQKDISSKEENKENTSDNRSVATKEDQKTTSSASKPPKDSSSSTDSALLKKYRHVKDANEVARIAKIMKTNWSAGKKNASDYSGDSDS